MDAKRGKLFTRLLKEIQIAAKMGGGNPEGNPRLKTAILSAKSMSVPSDNIERAIKRGTGDLEGVDYEEVTYEGYGPGGVAILVKVLTDNKNRMASDMRYAFTKAGGNLGGGNSVAYLFHDKGVVIVPKGKAKEEALLEAVLDAGAEDLQDSGDAWEIMAAPHDLPKVRQAVEKITSDFESEVRSIPSTTVKVSGKEADSLLKLLSALDEFDDVQNVAANFEIDDREMESLTSQQK